MTKQRFLVNKSYQIEKFNSKGGWTFVKIPEIPPNKNNRFGWVRVQGTIDNVKIEKYHLQPMGNGILFLPLNAKIRKKLSKKVGDFVHVKLYEDSIPIGLMKELVLCFKSEPKVFDTFMKMTKIEQKNTIEWIYVAKTDKIKIERITKSIDKMLNKIALDGL